MQNALSRKQEQLGLLAALAPFHAIIMNRITAASTATH